jgi:hypothetical protein
VLVHWETAVELENLGFNVYRSDSETGARSKVNANLIPGLGSAAGQAYDLLDATAQAGATYYYWLEDVSGTDETKIHGPAILRGTVPEVQGAIGSFVVPTGGVSRIGYAVMKAAGVGFSAAA